VRRMSSGLAGKGRYLWMKSGKVGGSWVGRNFAYRPIVLKSAEPLLGRPLSWRL